MSEISAYHEAGHAFVAIYVGARVRAVTIEPDRDDGPARYADIQIEWPLDRFTRREFLERSVWVALAGPVAEMIYRGETYHPREVVEWAADWHMAWEAAAPLAPSKQRRLAYLEKAIEQLKALLNQELSWAALAEIADQLLAHDRLEGDEVEDLVRPWLRRG